MKKNKTIIALLLIAAVIVVAIYISIQSWLPLKLQNNSTPPAPEILVEQEISLSLRAGDNIYQTKVKPGTTVYDLMSELRAAQGLSFIATEYPGMGPLIEEINGVKNDIKTNKFWFYYVNGQSANEGVTSYVLKNNDVIEWKYEESKF